jgi:hypothetical protein
MLCINNMKNEFLKRGGSGGNAASLPDSIKSGSFPSLLHHFTGGISRTSQTFFKQPGSPSEAG